MSQEPADYEEVEDPPHPARRKKFSLTELRVLELVVNLSIALLLMLLLVVMTYLIAYLRRGHG